MSYMKPEPPTVDGFSMEDVPLLKPQAVVMMPEVEQQPRRWKEHFCNIFGDCTAHDWAWCCMSQWAPCIAFGINMRRVFSISGFLQALVYLLLFGGVARIAQHTADTQCPMWEVNPEYVALYGEPTMPPPNHFPGHHHHHGDHHHHHDEKTVGRGSDEGPRGFQKGRPEVEFEFEIEMVAVEEHDSVPMKEMKPAAVEVEPKEETTEAKALKAAAATIASHPVVSKLKSFTDKQAQPTVNIRDQVEKAKAQKEMSKNGVQDYVGKLSKAFLNSEVAKKWWHATQAHKRRGLKHEDEEPAHHGPHPYTPVKKCVNVHLGVFAGVLVVFIIAASYAGMRRTQMREKFGIEGTAWRDFVAWLMCPFCALTQESRTLSHHGVEAGVWPAEAAGQVPAVVVMAV